MKKGIIFIWGAILLIGLSACNNSPTRVVKESRDLSGFTALFVHDGWNVLLRQGKTYSVEVETNKNIMEQAITKLEGDALHIYSDRSLEIASNPDIERTIFVTLPELDRIDASGGARISFEGKFKIKDFALKLSSGSTFTSDNLEVRSFSVRQSGGSELDVTFRSYTESINIIVDGGAETTLNKVDVSDFRLKGNGASIIRTAGLARNSDIKLRGAGKFFATSLKSNKMDLTLDGASSAEIFVTDSLDYKLSNASRLLKKGKAAVGLQEFDRTSRIEDK